LKNFTAFLLILLTAIVFNFNCGGKKVNNDKRITITFWHSFVFSTTPALNRLIAQFEKENPDIHVIAQYIPTGDALIQKLITSVQSKTAPDISWLHSDFIEPLVEANAIYKMDDFIKGKDSISKADLEDIYPSMIQYASWRGTMYSFPMEATNLALLYNKDMFKSAGLDPEKPPQTWDELYQYSKKLTFDKDGDGRFDQVGFFLPIYPAAGPLGAWMTWQWMPFLWQAGGDMINDAQTKVLYNSNAGIDALTLWKKIYSD
jgi:multiple sugar transport system substrate-binding protein